MPTTLIPTHRLPFAETELTRVRQPHFECSDLPQAVQISVFVPGVEPADVEITTRGPDLIVQARKPHPVRVNFNALHLEAAQRDYELKLRLGLGLDFDALRADIRDGVLSIVVPKKNSAFSRINSRKVA
jgi:HSP20 family molecular chaperone IbpA